MNDTKQFLLSVIASFMHTPYERTYPGPMLCADWAVLNGNNGESLLRPSVWDEARRYLDGLQAMGTRAVGLQMQYPLFDDAFPRNEAYKQLYQQAVEEARARGLYVYAETSPAFTGTPYSQIEWDYAGMTPEEYLLRRGMMAADIVAVTHPHALSVVHEIETERLLTGYDHLVPADFTSVMDRARKAGDGLAEPTLIGGGAPITAPFEDIQVFDRLGDFVNIHLYPLAVMERLQVVNMLCKLVDVAHRLSKPVVVGETWSFKAHPLEMRGENIIAQSLAFYARDPYALWESVDVSFLEAMYRVGEVAPVVLVNCFWSRYGYAYYHGESQDADYVNRFVNRKAVRNMERRRMTDTGLKYQELAVAERDTHIAVLEHELAAAQEKIKVLEAAPMREVNGETNE